MPGLLKYKIIFLNTRGKCPTLQESVNQDTGRSTGFGLHFLHLQTYQGLSSCLGVTAAFCWGMNHTALFKVGDLYFMFNSLVKWMHLFKTSALIPELWSLGCIFNEEAVTK